MDEIKQCQKDDQECQQIVLYCQQGWPEKKELTRKLRQYYPVAAEISVVDDLLMCGSRIIIPFSMREKDTCWPSRHNKVQRTCSTICLVARHILGPRRFSECEKCCISQKPCDQTLMPSKLPSLPWQKVATDLFEFKQRSYLLVVDYYSRFIEIALLNGTSADTVIQHTNMASQKSSYLIMDQFSSEAYRKFSNNYQFKHITSSPYYPRSNGEAERAVATIKSLLHFCKGIWTNWCMEVYST